MDVYQKVHGARTRSTTRWELTQECAPRDERGKWCTVQHDGNDRQVILSMVNQPGSQEMPETILDILREWGCTWMWRSLRLIGDDHWLEEAIEAGTCLAVTDGSYIKEFYPNVCSAAFILECREGRGRIIGSFPEKTVAACAYRGEMLGLMAIHLLLLAANKVWPNLSGRVSLHSDCKGALERIANLPATRIPT